MYPRYEQFGYTQQSGHGRHRSQTWAPPITGGDAAPVRRAPGGHPGPIEPLPTLVWPPTAPALAGYPEPGAPAHLAPLRPRRWRRTVALVGLSFVGGAFARPLVEDSLVDYLRSLPLEVRVGRSQLVGALPAELEPPAPAARTPASNPTAARAIVTTPLPTPRPLPPKPAEGVAPASEAPPAPTRAHSALAQAEAEAAALAARPPEVRSRPRHQDERANRRTPDARPVRLAMAEADVPAPVPSSPAAEPRSVRSNDPLGSLMDRALEAPTEAPAPRAPAAARGPLSHPQITGVMHGLGTALNACGAGLPRAANADLTVTVAPDGSVGAVKLAGPLFATLTAGCVVRVVRDARFPPSRGLTFPYRVTIRPVRSAGSYADLRPERIERPAPQGPAARPTPSSAGEARALPKLPPRVSVSDNPLAGLGEPTAPRAIEGKRTVKPKPPRRGRRR